MINSFTWQMNLTVRNLHKNDFASYVCMSENALGKSDTRIRLQGKRYNRKINFFAFFRSLIYGTSFVISNIAQSTTFKCENFSFNSMFVWLLLLLLQFFIMQNFICHQNQLPHRLHTSTRHPSKEIEINNSNNNIINIRRSMRMEKVETPRIHLVPIKFS